MRGWRRVTDTVHAAGGRIIAQLRHTGAIAHPDVRGGAQPLSASDVNLLFESVTPTGRKPTVAPRPMSTDEIGQTVADYARAARNAVEAGFDGVQILARSLRDPVQQARLRRRVRSKTEPASYSVEAVLAEVDPSRVGVKISPMHEGGPMAAHDETLPMVLPISRRCDRP